MYAAMTQPVRLEARLEAEPSRWLWVVKWLLLIPHAIVLFFLWIAFFAVSIVAFFAILITARYPRPLFDFNVGVLRWTWRVWYYGYGGLGTDRYPPFTLAEHPDYPARFDIVYLQRLSRGLVLVKWWLLVLPQLVLVGIFTAGAWRWGGLIPALVLFAGIALLFTGRYPRGIYALVIGLDRWVLRVVAYEALMTDRYPPFRLDPGGAEPQPKPQPEPDPHHE
ncbi:DUF4389 domain-containing protein [Embleya sp. NPDC008237]|uniref:DUF4389 domain-containing protein n=1 Tax=Embleya sp. NPDC008237 TaxID=3363978 RepID=UPI0036E54196